MVPTVSLTMATTFSSIACTQKDAASCWATWSSRQPLLDPEVSTAKGPPLRKQETLCSPQSLLQPQNTTGGRALACLRPMASRSRCTTSWPSQSDALKPFVQFRRMPWCGMETERPLGISLGLPKACNPSEAYDIPPPQAGFWAHSAIKLRALLSVPSQLPRSIPV